jgi:hypothetical protein
VIGLTGGEAAERKTAEAMKGGKRAVIEGEPLPPLEPLPEETIPRFAELGRPGVMIRVKGHRRR